VTKDRDRIQRHDYECRGELYAAAEREGEGVGGMIPSLALRAF
jgi:hypothetical protein